MPPPHPPPPTRLDGSLTGEGIELPFSALPPPHPPLTTRSDGSTKGGGVEMTSSVLPPPHPPPPLYPDMDIGFRGLGNTAGIYGWRTNGRCGEGAGRGL